MKVSSALFVSLLAMVSALAAPRMNDALAIPVNMTIRTNMTVHENRIVGPSTTALCDCTTPAHRVGKRKCQKRLKPFGFEIFWYTPDGLVHHKTKTGGRFYCWIWGDPSDEDDPLVCRGNPCWWARIRWANDRGHQFYQEGYLAHWQKGLWSDGQKQAIAELDKADLKEDVIDRICQPA